MEPTLQLLHQLQLSSAQPAEVAASTPATANSLHNATHSPLLALPNPTLHTIARMAGKPTRLACHHLAQAYALLPTSLRWPPPRASNSYGDVDEDGSMQQQLVDLLQTTRHAPQLTSLSIASCQLLQPNLFRTLATHLPNLRTLACPWLQRPRRGTEPPPVLTALTALDLQPAVPPNRLGFWSGDTPEPLQQAQLRMQAFAQLPRLLPSLQVLGITVGPHRFPDASFPAVMHQLNGRLTHLRLGHFFYRQQLSPAASHDTTHVLEGIAAVAGSLQHLTIAQPSALGPGLRDAMSVLLVLTSLQVTGGPQPDEDAFGCLPPCHLLPSLRQVDVAFRLVTGERVASAAAWLAEGQASTTLRSLSLPLVMGANGDHDGLDAGPLLEACAHYKQLTALEVSAVNRQVTGWPAAISRLEGLQLLSVSMPVDELNSVAAWGALTQLTCLSLALMSRNGGSGVADVVTEATIRAGLGRLVGLRTAVFSLHLACVDVAIMGLGGPDLRSDVELCGAGLLRAWVLKALAALPQLEVLDVSEAWPASEVQRSRGEGGGGDTGEGEREGCEGRGQGANRRPDDGHFRELGVLAGSPACRSLRQLVLPMGCPEGRVRSLQGLLPGVAVHPLRGPPQNL